MTRPARSDRRRLVEALGLGPLWVLRTSDAVPGFEADGTALDWEALEQGISSGRAGGLRLTQSPVFGAGRPEWLVIGADLEGDASVRPAGRLLDAMLAAIGLARDRTVVVAGLAMCAPHAAGGGAGGSYLQRQIELLAPRMILVVGDAAATALFPDGSNFDDFRGRPNTLKIAGRDIPVVATFHPSRLLEDGAAKALAWADLSLARSIHERMSAAVFA